MSTMYRLPFVVLLLAGLVAATSRPTAACICDEEEPIAPAVQRADAVFTGVVVNTPRESGLAGLLRYGPGITLDVTGSWKGVSVSGVTIVEPQSGTWCGGEFHVGESYLVYAQRWDRSLGASFQTEHCNRSAPLALAERDLQHLGIPPVRPQPDDYGWSAALTFAGVALGLTALASAHQRHRRTQPAPRTL